jgi:hypothetical protein
MKNNRNLTLINIQHQKNDSILEYIGGSEREEEYQE